MEPSVPYSIKESETLGRYLVAEKDFNRGDIIFEEYPIMTGVTSEGLDPEFTCIECYKDTDDKCPGCGFPVCDVHDDRLPNQHSTLECDLLCRAKQHLGITEQTNDENRSKALALIRSQLYFMRCLMLEPNRDAELKLLSTNIEQWRRSNLAVEFETQMVLLRELFGTFYEFPSHQDMCEVKARLDTNALEVKLLAGGVLGVYSKTSLLEHNCLPSTHRSARNEDMKLTIRAAQAIPKGSHLSMSYVDLLATTADRQQQLKETKFFTCVCTRCLDPSECGSLISALRCPTCSTNEVDNPMLPVFAQDENANSSFVESYSCTVCGLVKDYEEVKQVLEKAGGESDMIEELSKDDDEIGPEVRVQFLVDWLKKWTSPRFIAKLNPTEFDWSEAAAAAKRAKAKDADPEKLQLHPHNELVVNICHSILLLQFFWEEDISDDLPFKVSVGRHVLEAITPITPEFSSLRCIVMYVLGEAELKNHVADLKKKNPSIPFARRVAEVHESYDMCQHALDFLQYEPPNSSEGILYAQGKATLKNLAMKLKIFLLSHIPGSSV